MPNTTSNRRAPAWAPAIAVAALLPACLGLAACGGSSSGSTTATNAAATATATPAGGTGATGATGGAGATRPGTAGGAGATGKAGAGSSVPNTPGTTGAPGARAGRFQALRECLEKNGVTLPQRAPGQRRSGAPGGLLGGARGSQLPHGVTRAQYEAAIRKCGGGAFAGGRARNNPAFKQTLTKFTACMRENGVRLPAPNTAGGGPIFNTKGIDTSSPQFKAALSKCSHALRSTVPPGSHAGAAPAGPPPGETPAG